jgi:hypothetical protein
MWTRKAICVRMPSRKDCWSPNASTPSLAAVLAGRAMRPQDRPCGPCGPHGCHVERVNAAGGVDHGGPRHGGRPMRPPRLGVRSAWRGTTCPCGCTRRHNRYGCKATSSQAVVGARDAVAGHDGSTRGCRAPVLLRTGAWFSAIYAIEACPSACQPSNHGIGTTSDHQG